MKHIDIVEIMSNAELLDSKVTVCGWVRTSRDSKTWRLLSLMTVLPSSICR